MFAEIFAVDLAAVVEQDVTEEKRDKKAEKTELKEVCQEGEIKVNEPQLISPISLFNFSSQVPMPITLNKQERAILPKPIEKLVDTLPKPIINHKNSEVQKLEKVSKKEEKTEKPKLAVCPSAPEQKQHRRVRRNTERGAFEKTKNRNLSSADSQRKATRSNASMELPGGLTDNVKVENYASSISKERS